MDSYEIVAGDSLDHLMLSLKERLEQLGPHQKLLVTFSTHSNRSWGEMQKEIMTRLLAHAGRQSIAVLAKELGVAEDILRDIRSAHRVVDLGVIEAMPDVFGVAVDHPDLQALREIAKTYRVPGRSARHEPLSPALCAQKEIFTRLRKRRQGSRLQDIAERLQISREHASLVVNGNRPLTMKVWRRLSEAFGIEDADSDIQALHALLRGKLPVQSEVP